MYPVREVQQSFPKVREIFLISYLSVLPDDTIVITNDDIILKTWKKLESKIPYGEFLYIKKIISDRFYNSTRNFDLLIYGKRTPSLGFMRLYFDTISKYGIKIDLQQILKTSRIKFGHGGNAASALLPSHLSQKLAYLVGAMRDGTLARSGKYEISISQSNDSWLKTLKEIICDVFQPSNEPAIRNNRVTLSNRPIFEYLNKVFEIPIGKKDQWSTPKIIEMAPLNLAKYYIRGFYDADGLSYKLGFCQVNKESLVFVKNTLEKLQIKTGKLSSRKGKSKILYSFNTSKKSHNDFIKIIGSLNPSKQRLFSPT